MKPDISFCSRQMPESLAGLAVGHALADRTVDGFRLQQHGTANRQGAGGVYGASRTGSKSLTRAASSALTHWFSPSRLVSSRVVSMTAYDHSDTIVYTWLSTWYMEPMVFFFMFRFKHRIRGLAPTLACLAALTAPLMPTMADDDMPAPFYIIKHADNPDSLQAMASAPLEEGRSHSIRIMFQARNIHISDFFMAPNNALGRVNTI